MHRGPNSFLVADECNSAHSFGHYLSYFAAASPLIETFLRKKRNNTFPHLTAITRNICVIRFSQSENNIEKNHTSKVFGIGDD